MARMNKSAWKNGTPRTRKPDTHTPAIADAHASGTAAWAKANGFVSVTGEPLVFSSSQRRMVERAAARQGVTFTN